jgi:hypothetical protein
MVNLRGKPLHLVQRWNGDGPREKSAGGGEIHRLGA